MTYVLQDFVVMSVNMICQFDERAATEDTESTGKVFQLDAIFGMAGQHRTVVNVVFLLQMFDESTLSSKLPANAPGNVCVEVYRVWVGVVAECAFWSILCIYQRLLRNAEVLFEMLS